MDISLTENQIKQEPDRFSKMLEHVDPSSSHPVFIVGYMHSGTTLLRKILGASSDIFAIRAETNFYPQLRINIRRMFPDLNDQEIFNDYVRFLIKKTKFDYPPVTKAEAAENQALFDLTPAQEQAVIDAVQLYRDYELAFVAVFNSIAKLAGRSRWLEKTPDHVLFIDQILEVVPQAQFIELVRDPRDIIASKRARRNKDWTQKYGDIESQRLQAGLGFDPLRDSLGWKSAVQAGTKAHRASPDSIFRIRYEDLVQSPEAEIKRLCEFLDIPFSESMLQVSWSNTTISNGKEPKKGIQADAVRKWEKGLPKGALAICQQVCSAEMIAMGYQLASLNLFDRVRMLYWLARSGFDYALRLARIARKRGPDYVTSMVLNSFRGLTFLFKKPKYR